MAELFQRKDRSHPRAVQAAAAIVLAAVALGGCEVARPYVYNPAAYDREHVNFAKPPETRDSVTVCYSKYASKPKDVARLAAETCGFYDSGIQFTGNTFSQCPLATPVGAVFSCIGAKDTVTKPADRTGTVRGTAGIPGQPGAPLSGYQEGARPMGQLFGRPAPASVPETPPAIPGEPAAKQ